MAKGLRKVLLRYREGFARLLQPPARKDSLGCAHR
jgi:hypothetical protein